MIANIGIRLSPQEKESLVTIAKRTDTTISQIMRKLIRTFITMQGEEEAAAQKENDYEHQSNESIDAQTHHGKQSRF